MGNGTMDVRMPDGTIVKNVPEGTTRDQLMEKLKANTTKAAAPQSPAAQQHFDESYAGKVTRGVGGVLDVARAGVTGAGADVVGGLMGAATLGTNAMGLTHDDPVEMIRNWQSKAYPLTTEAGKEIAGGIGAISKAFVGEPGKKLGEHFLQVTGSPLEATIAELMPDAIATITGAEAPAFLKEAAVKGAGKIAMKAVANKAKDDAARSAVTANLKISPSEYGGAISRTITGASNKAEVERMVSGHNADRVVELGRINMQMPPTAPMDRASYAAARFNASREYEEGRGLGRMELDAPFLGDILNSGRKFEQVAQDFPASDLAKLDTQIKELKGTYIVPAWDASSAIDQMSFLRERSADLLNSESAVERKLGFVYRGISEAFEDRLFRHANSVGRPDFASRFQGSRKRLAQIHVWQDATNFNTGKISARQIVAQREMVAGTTDPFTDELKLVADTAGAFPKSFQDVDVKGRYGPISVFERYALIGGAFSAMSGERMAAGGMMAIAGSGIAGRAAVTSKAGQAMSRRTPSYKPGPIRKSVMASGDTAEVAGAVAGEESGNQ